MLYILLVVGLNVIYTTSPNNNDNKKGEMEN